MFRYPLDSVIFFIMLSISNFILNYSGLYHYYLVVKYDLYVLITVSRLSVKSVDILSCLSTFYILYYLSIQLRDCCD